MPLQFTLDNLQCINLIRREAVVFSVLQRSIRTKLYEKRDDISFLIVNFTFHDGVIPLTPLYGVYISQFVLLHVYAPILILTNIMFVLPVHYHVSDFVTKNYFKLHQIQS